jgi:8-oxo-dGTP diphosphatase
LDHRISAGAFVEHDGRLLLVRHRKENAYDFWVAPGGGVQGAESLASAAEREVREETGLVVAADRLVYVEEFHNPETRHCKFWFIATLVGGTLSVDAPEACAEHIIDAAWHTEDQVRSLQVFPAVLQARYWQDRGHGFNEGLVYLPLREMTIW